MGCQTGPPIGARDWEQLAVAQVLVVEPFAACSHPATMRVQTHAGLVGWLCMMAA